MIEGENYIYIYKIAVSYTHLDVYKRQILYSISITCYTYLAQIKLNDIIN